MAYANSSLLWSLIIAYININYISIMLGSGYYRQNFKEKFKFQYIIIIIIIIN